MTVPQTSTALDGLLRVEHGAAEAPFEQVRRQLGQAIGDGRLPTGTRLPPIRTLALELDLAANTVARAYRELEEAGLVLTRGRAGTVVSPDAGPTAPAGGTGPSSAAPLPAEVRLAAADYARTARGAGVGEADAVALVRDAFGRRA